MQKTIATSELRQHIDAVLEEVSSQHTAYVLTADDRPRAAVAPRGAPRARELPDSPTRLEGRGSATGGALGGDAPSAISCLRTGRRLPRPRREHLGAGGRLGSAADHRVRGLCPRPLVALRILPEHLSHRALLLLRVAVQVVQRPFPQSAGLVHRVRRLRQRLSGGSAAARPLGGGGRASGSVGRRRTGPQSLPRVRRLRARL